MRAGFKAILSDIKEYSLESIIMEAMKKEERMTKMLRRQRMWETKHICKGILEEVLGTVVQSSTMEYDLEMAFMMEIEGEVIEEMEWNQEYDWTRTDGLAEILRRMEISACMMETLRWC